MATIFVFYTINIDGSRWKYTNLPKTWTWTGSGVTGSVTKSGKFSKYEREEQFNGPKQTREKTKLYLDKYFKKLEKEGIVKFYKIKYSYCP